MLAMKSGKRILFKFFPYTLSISSVGIGPYFIRLGWSRICDPVNLIFIGFTQKELQMLFLENKWRVTYAFDQYMVIRSKLVSTIYQCDWDVPSDDEKRFHVRFFNAGIIDGVPWILASAHKEYKEYDVGDHIVLSWDAARNFTAYFFRKFRHERSGLLTQINWRRKQSDGRAVIIYKN